MPDHLSTAGRSRVMAAIRSSDTKPELALRAELRRRGLTGYRLHRRDLPGTPDLAYVRWHVAVFVDGVFWHGHPEHFNPCPASDYWRTKIARTQQRDAAASRDLLATGWQVVRAWDLEVRSGVGGVADRVELALQAAGRPRGTLRSAVVVPGAA